MKKLLFLSAILLFTIRPITSFAWGKTGHHIVAEIAKAHLEPGVLDSVQKYLGVMSFEDAATWMDDVRRDTSYTYMKPWHYINIAKDKTYFFTTLDDAEALNNVVEQIEIAKDQLTSREGRSAADINMDLKLLFHLIGDLHQPLHTGYAEDKGGNDIKVKFLGKNTNLHWVWDDEIIQSKKITYEQIEAKCSKLSKKKLKKIQSPDVLQWTAESRAYLPNVYAFTNNEIDQKYVDTNANIIEDRLMYGGLRLAGVLNNAFRKKIIK